LLMGFCEVSKDGKFQTKGDLRVLYSTMMFIRMLLIKDVG
jgi:acyl-CoA oxidase